jgi:hypothetical protein
MYTPLYTIRIHQSLFMTGQALKPYTRMFYEINIPRTRAVKEITDMPDLTDI